MRETNLDKNFQIHQVLPSQLFDVVEALLLDGGYPTRPDFIPLAAIKKKLVQ